MSVDLYDSQKQAVRKLKTGSILKGGVGTGKSRTSLAYFHVKVCGGKLPRRGSTFDPGKRIPLYVITTAKKRDDGDWEREAAPFLLSAQPDVNGHVDMVVDSWNNIKKYADVKGAFFIFDEQRVVGYGAWSKTFIKIAKNNDWILLSATPGDAWIDYAPVFIANGFYKNITDFRTKHVIYHHHTDYPKIVGYSNQKRLEYLRDHITVELQSEKRATQHHEWVKVGYDTELYNYATENRWDIFKNVPVKNASELCYLQRKIVNGDNHRMTAMQNILVRHPKAIVFYNFDYELEMLRHFCDSVGYEYAEWNGHKHEPLPEGKAWLYLVNYAAGAEGWECFTTDTIIFLSQSYSYRTTIQASGRIDRTNTKYMDLYYYHLFSDAVIDKTIRQCLRKKKDFNEKAYFKKLDFKEEELDDLVPEKVRQNAKKTAPTQLSLF